MSNSDPKSRPRPGPWPPAPDNSALPPSSWAKRTGFRPKFSGETNASDSGQISLPPRPSPASREPDPAAQPDLEAGRPRPPPPTVNGQPEKEKEKAQTAAEKEKAVKKRSGAGANGNAPNPAVAAEPGAAAQQRRTVRSEEAVDALPPQIGVGGHWKCGINSAVCVRSNHAVAHVFRFKVALDTGSIICFPRSCIGDYQLPGISRTQWKCNVSILVLLLVK
ncbi:hypothetical protein TIFTF001_025367 [Ficus carica]|uniref:Uncharacterized protein n=1 Tax=Ficus carica TaxID=3494 RepID=A0AA88DH82_FICCA|nr:hypothetical protein TIFTF001_025367 [Ficus carica]